MITWHDDAEAFLAAAKRLMERIEAIEDHVEGQASIPGFCAVCEAITSFRTDAGVRMGEHVSLREGMLCERCGVSSRGRLLFDAMVETVGRNRAIDGAILEAISPLARAVAERFPRVRGSEYLGSDAPAGSERMLHGRPVRHESLLGLSYADASLDLIVHNDVLEHIYDTDQALRESKRVLRSGGACVFLMPFFPFVANTQIRGRLNDDGSIEHIEEPEYHGDGVTNRGIYTFYHFGLDFFERLRRAGFRKVEVGLAYDVFQGYVSNNYRYGSDGVVLPTVFRAYAA